MKSGLKKLFVFALAVLFLSSTFGCGNGKITCYPESEDKGEKVELFSHQIMFSQTMLYFYAYENSDTDFSVLSSSLNDGVMQELDITIPDDVEYDYAMPVYAGGGGGSLECEFIIELHDKDKVFYVSFDNFDYSTPENILDFKYRGIVSDARLSELRDIAPDVFE